MSKFKPPPNIQEWVNGDASHQLDGVVSLRVEKCFDPNRNLLSPKIVFLTSIFRCHLLSLPFLANILRKLYFAETLLTKLCTLVYFTCSTTCLSFSSNKYILQNLTNASQRLLLLIAILLLFIVEKVLKFSDRAVIFSSHSSDISEPLPYQ